MMTKSIVGNEQTARKRTIREIGGEVWSELRNSIPEDEASWKVKNKIVDVVMKILARYEGHIIENDEDLPVRP